MRPWIIGTAALMTLAGGPAAAADLDVVDAAPKAPTPPKEPPASDWRATGADGYEHLQSGLSCPKQLDGYQRDDAHVFDSAGLDVSCDYIKDKTIVTVYVRQGTDGPDDSIAGAEAALMQVRADRHPKLVSEFTKVLDGRPWSAAVFSIDPDLHSGILLSDIAGWTVEFRVTYPQADDARVGADLAVFRKALEGSAGAKLDVCAKASPPPARTGRPVTDAKSIQQTAIMASVLGGAEMSTAKPGETRETSAPTWCMEWAGRAGDRELLYWRAVRSGGADGSADRITAATQGPPPTLDISFDPMQALIASQTHQPAYWQAAIQSSTGVGIYGYFDARPPREAVQALFIDILDGKAKAVGGYSVRGKNIYIDMPK